MNKKFLSEHQLKIKAEFRKYRSNLIKNPSEIHPALIRLGEMKGPIIHAEPHIHPFDNEKVWSQIPFAGTLLISLFNVPKEMCLKENGFEPNDIPDLIKLAKETGKIKFTLQTNALDYEGLDYLDPIIEEFEPSSTYIDSEMDKYSNFEDRKKWAVEFDEIASIRYFKSLRHNVLRNGGTHSFVDAVIRGRRLAWENMKMVGMDDQLEQLTNLLVDDPIQAEELFTACIMKTSPIFNPITKNCNYSLGRLNKFKVDSDLASGVRIPELGRTLLNKLVLNPGSYYGCVNAIQKYKDNDLYKLLDSFENALSETNGEKIIESKKRLEEVVDNVWNDVKKTSQQIRGVKSGLTIALGIGGTYCTTALQGAAAIDPGFAPIDALGGLLAGLGFNTAESHFGLKKNLSERLVSRFKPNYLVNILDFSKKYDIK